MEAHMKTFRVLHICDFSADYRGNFIDSLESIETYHDDVENFYLFPFRAKHTAAQGWIDELNSNRQRAYIQEKNMIQNFVLLAKILKKHNINRIVRHFSDKKIDILIKLLFNGKQVIRFFHCDCPTNKSFIKSKVSEFVWRGNKLVGVSNAVTGHIRQAHPSFDAFTIVNAIQFNRLDQQEDFEKSEGIPLMMMGWDHTIKGVDLAIKAIRPLQKKYNLTLQIVSGMNENNIKKLARDILGEDVDWIRYLPSTNKIGTYYRSSDIFLSPSRKEAFGYSNIEAVYCGACIVLSKVGGQAELHIPGAYWFDSENIEEFSKKLESAILEFNLPEKIAQRELAKEEVQHTYSLEEWTNRLVNLF